MLKPLLQERYLPGQHPDPVFTGNLVAVFRTTASTVRMAAVETGIAVVRTVTAVPMASVPALTIAVSMAATHPV
jgi:hypothetical protein